MTTTDPIADRLAELRDSYAGRRTVAGQMLDQAVRLVEASAAYHARQTEDRIVLLEQQHDRELERAAERERRAVDRAERAEAAEKAYRQQQTNLRESRETVDDGTLVKIQAPRIPGYGDKTHPRPWTLGELDQVMYRLRAGGATDDTEVRFKHEHAEACIPFPEMVLDAPRPPARIAPAERPSRSLVRALVDWRLAPAGLVAVVVVMVIAAVVR